jgi:hypothetical protein
MIGEPPSLPGVQLTPMIPARVTSSSFAIAEGASGTLADRIVMG